MLQIVVVLSLLGAGEIPAAAAGPLAIAYLSVGLSMVLVDGFFLMRRRGHQEPNPLLAMLRFFAQMMVLIPGIIAATVGYALVPGMAVPALIGAVVQLLVGMLLLFGVARALDAP